MKRIAFALLALATALAIIPPAPAMASSYSYVDWTSATPGLVSGTLKIGSGTVGVTFTGDYAFAQINNIGQNFYLPPGTFTNSTVSNPPTNVDIIALDERGAANGSAHYSIQFDAAVLNPILDIVSLGWTGVSNVTYNFDSA